MDIEESIVSPLAGHVGLKMIIIIITNVGY